MFEVWGHFHASQILCGLFFAQKKKQVLHFDHHVVAAAAQNQKLHVDHHVAAAAAVAQQKHQKLHFDHAIDLVAAAVALQKLHFDDAIDIAAAVAHQNDQLHFGHTTQHCTHQASSLRASPLLKKQILHTKKPTSSEQFFPPNPQHPFPTQTLSGRPLATNFN